MASTIRRENCQDCNKRNLCYFLGDDGQEKAKCQTIGCKGKHKMIKEDKKQNTDILEFKEFTKSWRGISHNTLNFLGIKQAIFDVDEVIQYRHNNLDGTVSFKERWPEKKFRWESSQPNTSMFALDKCTEFDRPLCITEGNEDAASLWDLGFQACSLLSANEKTKEVLLDIDYISKFCEIWICVEQDNAGLIAIQSIKNLLQHKLVRQIDFNPYKDANEALQADKTNLVKAMSISTEIVPKGIIFGNQIDSKILRIPLPKGIELPYKKTQGFTKGILPGHLWVLTAGVSIGKSSVIRDFSVHFREQGYKVGNIFVEEDSRVSQQNYIATELGYPIGDVMENPLIIPQDKWDEAFEKTLNNPDIMFITEEWDNNTANLIKTCEYLAKVKKYDILVLDHLTALINASSTGRGGKVQDIDLLMEQLFSICRKTGLRIILVSHLKRPSDGKGNWDEGRRPSMYDLRGSGALEQKPDVIIGMSRNQKNDATCDLLQLEVLKNRWFSKLGLTDELIYISKTGRLVQK